MDGYQPLVSELSTEVVVQDDSSETARVKHIAQSAEWGQNILRPRVVKQEDN